MKYIINFRSNVCDSKIYYLEASCLEDAIEDFLYTYDEENAEMIEDNSSITIIQRDDDSFWEYTLSKAPIAE